MKPSLKKYAAAVQAAGRGEDKVLAHITKGEAASLGRFGHTVNPKTGLPEYGILGIIGAIVGAVFGAPVFGSALLGSAIGGAVGGIAEGQDPGKAILGGALSFGIGHVINFFSDAAGFSTSFSDLFGGGSSELAGTAAAEGAGATTAAAEAAGGDLIAAHDISGLGVNVGEFAGTPTNPIDTISAADASNLAHAWEGAIADSAAQGAALKTAADISGAGAQKGFLNSAIDWAKENPQLATGLALAGGGVLKGVGDAAAARELLQEKLQQAKELEEWKRRFTQEGSYWTGTLPFSAPRQQVPLRRPDGTLVYAPTGFLNHAINV